MTLKEMIRSDFEEFIRLDPSVPEGLKNSLRLKERSPVFLNNLVVEIENCDRMGIQIDRMKIKGIVYDMAKTFVGLLKVKADEMHMSDLAKSVRKAELEGDELVQKLDNDGNADLTEELGVIITGKDEDYVGTGKQ